MTISPQEFARIAQETLEREWTLWVERGGIDEEKPMKLDDDWLGGEAWSVGLPCFPPKVELAKELLLVSCALADLAERVDAVREKLEKL